MAPPDFEVVPPGVVDAACGVPGPPIFKGGGVDIGPERPDKEEADATGDCAEKGCFSGDDEDHLDEASAVRERSQRAERVGGRQSCTACHVGSSITPLFARAASLLFAPPEREGAPEGEGNHPPAAVPLAAEASAADAESQVAAEDCASRASVAAAPSASAAERLALVRSGAQRLTTSLGARAATTRCFLNEALRSAAGGAESEADVESAVDTEGSARETAATDVKHVEEDVVSTTSYLASTASAACRGTWQRMPPLLRRLKFAPLATAEYLGAMPTPTAQDCDADAAAVSDLAQECWQLWRRKHAAISASERLYASLLADSRRAGALSAEVKAVEALFDAEDGDVDGDGGQVPRPVASSSSSASLDGREAASRLARRRASSEPLNQEVALTALASCCSAIEAQAAEAKDAFRERVRNYPCGRVSEVTGQLRISRSPEEVDQVIEAFEERVDMETREALTQALEITVVPCAGALADVLGRRLAFWEAEIEESWSHWSAQASLFHDACRGAAEVWQKLRESTRALIDKLAEPTSVPSEETPPIVYLVPFLDYRAVQRHRRWDDAHDALAHAAASVALLGAWTEYHHLRGDGEVLKEARELLNTLLEALESRFDPSRYAGSEAATSALAMDETWCLVAPLAERSWQLRQVQDGGPLCPSEASVPSEGSHPWWSPKSWRRVGDDDTGTPTEMDSATAALDAASAALATASALGSDEDATGFGR